MHLFLTFNKVGMRHGKGMSFITSIDQKFGCIIIQMSSSVSIYKIHDIARAKNLFAIMEDIFSTHF